MASRRVVGRWLRVVGRWSRAVGHWSWVVGPWSWVVGRGPMAVGLQAINTCFMSESHGTRRSTSGAISSMFHMYFRLPANVTSSSASSRFLPCRVQTTQTNSWRHSGSSPQLEAQHFQRHEGLRGGSWVVGRGSLVVGRGPLVVGRRSLVLGHWSWVGGSGLLVLGRWSWVLGRRS